MAPWRPWIIPGIFLGLIFFGLAGGLWIGLTIGRGGQASAPQGAKAPSDQVGKVEKVGKVAEVVKVPETRKETRSPEEELVAKLLRERCPDPAKLEFVTWGPHDLENKECEFKGSCQLCAQRKAA